MNRVRDLQVLREDLWRKVKELPGVVTIGIGSKGNRSAFVIFVDEDRVRKDELPVKYANVAVVLRPAGPASAHGG